MVLDGDLPGGMDVAGHQAAVAALERSRAAGRVAHAYLFVGPVGIGRTTLAVEFAKALNCKAAAQPPCGRCSTCRRIAERKHPDVEIVGPNAPCDESQHDHSTESGRDVRVCQVRRLERMAQMAPYEGGMRVLIVEPAEAMNATASDAFLKTLEEPPPGTVFVLVTANEGALSETVRSRCRRVPLHPPAVAETEKALRERFDAEPEQAEALVRVFGGYLARCVAALRDTLYFDRRAALLEVAAEVLSGSLAQRFKVADQLADAWAKRERPKSEDGIATRAPVLPSEGKPRSRDEVLATLDVWIEWWRDLLLICAGAAPLLVHRGQEAQLASLAARLDTATARAGLVAVRECRRDLEQNVQARLALESLMLRLPRLRTAGAGARRG